MNINIDLIYPIGSIYKNTSSINPSNFLGGTWIAKEEPQIVACVRSTENGYTLYNSKNILSVSYEGGGSYDITFSKTMKDTNYLVSISQGSSRQTFYISSRTTSSFNCQILNASGVGVSCPQMDIIVVGFLQEPEYYEWERTA